MDGGNPEVRRKHPIEDQLLAKLFGATATWCWLYKRGKGKWPTERHGPAPDAPGTKVDPIVLSRHGYADPGNYASWKERHHV